jgi:hypothetical protein
MFLTEKELHLIQTTLIYLNLKIILNPGCYDY